MERSADRFVIHPFLFGLVPILYTFFDTFPQYRIDQTFRFIGIYLLSTVIILGIWRLILRSWERAALVTSWFIMLYSSCGSAYLYANRQFPDTVISRADVLFAIWTSALIIGTWFLIRVLRKTAFLTRLFSATAIFLILFNFIGILYKGFSMHIFEQTFTPVVHAEIETTLPVDLKQQDDFPDIYYIILDGYGRSDVLQEVFDLDNSSLIEYLQNKGFYIANQSYSNYTQTHYSLTSSLNIQYLDQLVSLDPDTFSGYALDPYFQHNEVMAFFKERGYRTYSFDPGFNIIIRSVDVYIPRSTQLNGFELYTIQNSASVLWYGSFSQKLIYTNTNNQFENLRGVIDDPGPKFVFYHILSPHPPFIMASDGKIIPNMPVSTNDGSWFGGTTDEYTFGYSEQVKYLEKQVEQTIDQILMQPGQKPIIIIQGDHGSRKYTFENSYEQTCMREAFSILNAYYFPDGDYTHLTPDITPVNSFRVVMNTHFGTDLPLLANRHYFSNWSPPTYFYKVGDERLAIRCQDN